MILQQIPDLTLEEFERRSRALEEGSRRIFRSLESTLAHCVKIGAIDPDQAEAIARARKVAPRSRKRGKSDSGS